ncbi:hypothetical protein DID88_007967 [Monilinia fructigena]|uniref:Pelota N-terminal domain-containing protein n=1 Tax=Monilinia fructigena TaxID=38457 RepID=A0A395J3X7_9HELO|nr:hypothetical protein DID88_007967 [Monilinia fructigena]
MRLIKEDIASDDSGTVTLLPEEPEDMWHAYNLIAPMIPARPRCASRLHRNLLTGKASPQHAYKNSAYYRRNINRF